MADKLLAFLQKRWVRTVGLVPAAIYTYLASLAVYTVIKTTVLQPPNEIFTGTDLVGLLGILLFLGVVGGSGILAILTAYYMKGVFRILYLAGILAILSVVAVFPLSIMYNSTTYESSVSIDYPEFLVGTWINDYYRLELSADGTYELYYQTDWLWIHDSLRYEGDWRLEGNRLHLSNINPRWANPWEVCSNRGYYFVRYEIPENPDAWSGNLGLMREADWLATH